jgi:hypothetical protein
MTQTEMMRFIPLVTLLSLLLRGAPLHAFEQAGDAAVSSGVPHIPEPMVFDLVRPLGVRRGEFEANALFQYVPESGEVEWAPEIEYGVFDGFAIEFELPFTGSSLQEYKAAAQGTLASAGGFVHGWQVIARRARDDAEYSVDGLYLAGYSWPGPTSMLSMIGIRTEGIGSALRNLAIVNSAWFIDLSAALTLGLEVNLELAERSNYLVMPQIHGDLSEQVTIQLGCGRTGGADRTAAWELAGRFIVAF